MNTSDQGEVCEDVTAFAATLDEVVAAPSSAAPSEPPVDGADPPGEAWSSPFSPPATERHAAFLKCVDTKLKASLQQRFARAADFAGQAAAAGVALFGDDSVIVAFLRASEATQYSNQAIEEAKRGCGADAFQLHRRSWVVLVALVLPVLESRIDGGTLLPGGCRAEEAAYYVYEQEAVMRLKGIPNSEEALRRRWASVVGYDAALQAAWLALNLLPFRQLGSAGQRGRARAFVLATIRLIPATACVPHRLPSEDVLVDMFEPELTPEDHGADFCAAVLALWRSPAVAGVLRARGALQGGVAAKAAADAEFAERQAADLAKYGLQRCALPSCGRREATALQFRVCGACKTTRYCGPEHQAAHAEAHRPHCSGRG